MSFMEKAQQREVDIDAIAEVIYTAIHGNDGWRKAKIFAATLQHYRELVEDTRLMAENLLASSWLDEKLEDARQDGFSDGVDSAGYM